MPPPEPEPCEPRPEAAGEPPPRADDARDPDGVLRASPWLVPRPLAEPGGVAASPALPLPLPRPLERPRPSADDAPSPAGSPLAEGPRPDDATSPAVVRRAPLPRRDGSEVLVNFRLWASRPSSSWSEPVPALKDARPRRRMMSSRLSSSGSAGSTAGSGRARTTRRLPGPSSGTRDGGMAGERVGEVSGTYLSSALVVSSSSKSASVSKSTGTEELAVGSARASWPQGLRPPRSP